MLGHKINKRLILSREIEPDSHPDLSVDEGKNGGGVGSWVHEEKHRYLATYIDAARSAVNSGKFSQWVYIDPFCGPGRMRAKNESMTRPGGAMVAWRQSEISGAAFGKVLVGDIDGEKASACHQRLAAAGCGVKSFVGPADETVQSMIREVPPRALCLVYIDPYNLPLLSFKMIKALAALPKVDFVVHFSTMDLVRNVDAELDPQRARFDEVSPGWRERLGNTYNKTRLPAAFFDDWHAAVKGLGFTFSKGVPLIRNDDQREIYKLVFFARHDLPLKLWGDVSRDATRSLFD
jgi:three-Cys-motif partner protein